MQSEYVQSESKIQELQQKFKIPSEIYWEHVTNRRGKLLEEGLYHLENEKAFSEVRENSGRAP